jgi:hypothetical protein
MKIIQFHFAWCDSTFTRRFRSAVSLHSHTMHSRESLDFLPHIARNFPFVRYAVAAHERQYRRKCGHPLDLAAAYWTPPLPERAALEVEQTQIEGSLGLKALMSLTDHDTIEAPLRLHRLSETQGVPISVEWTVPYGSTFFHLGIHNLPRATARLWMNCLESYTSKPSPEVLRELLAALSGRPEILVVFNHPCWDEKGIGAERHMELAIEFIEEHGQWFHALELNGMRSWAENLRVIALARFFGICVLSGGDRHGSEANTVLNLTNAATFEEFADEVRRDRISDVLILPQYRASFRLRFWEAAWDVLRDYPEHAGRVHWTDRFFYQTATGEHAPLSNVWCGDDPRIIGAYMSVMRLLGYPRVRSTLRLAMRASGEALP